VRKEESKAKASSKSTSDLSVLEDNYCKYFLNSKGLDEDSDSDDDFGSIEGDINSDDDEDASSTHSDSVEANDTSKNYHFYVCKIRSKKVHTKNRLRRSNSNDSISSHTSYRSRLSAASSDEFDQDTEEEETFDEYNNDNEENDAKSQSNMQECNKLTDEDHFTFLNETTEILKRGLKNNLNPDNLILEINSCKHANNIQIDDLCYFLTKALLNLPIVLNNQASYLKTFKAYIQDLLKDLLVNYFTKTKKSQKIFLDATLDYFVEIKRANTLSNLDADYARLIHFLYNDVELLDEVDIYSRCSWICF